MSRFARSDVEAAFERYWTTGPVGEDWAAWTNLFTPDAHYLDHFWGPLHGREEIGVWIDAVMKGVPEIYTVLDWYTIDGDVVTFHCQNRRDNPGADGPPYWDFPGLSVLWYGGDGLWRAEEDFWDRGGARSTSVDYAEACRRAGATTPESRMTRTHWPADGPEWSRLAASATVSPSWVGRDDIAGITKPRELRELLAPLRD